MGHIVNTLAFRLGNSIVWPDHWFIKNIYYSYFLHSIFKIRFYCMYFFFARHYDRKAIFFSHFEILKNYKKININIYYYDGKWEDEFEDYKWELYIKYYYLDVNRDPETRISFKRFVLLKIYNVIYLILGIQMWYFDRNFRYFNRRMFWYLLKTKNYILYYKTYMKKYEKKKLLIYKKRIFYFFFFVYLLISMRKIMRKSSIFIYPNSDSTIRRYYYIGVAQRYSKRWAKPMSHVYSYYFKGMINSWYKVNMHFYLTDNNCVNARFLSRYIARKLQQGSYLKQLLNPIKKELLYLMRLSLIPQSLYYSKVYRKSYIYQSYYWAKKGYYKNFIYTTYYIYKKILNNFYKNYNMYYNLDILIKIYYFYENYLINNTKKIFYKKIFSFLYSNIIYVSIFEYKLLINDLVKIFINKSNKAIKSSSKEKFDGLLLFAYKSLYINKLTFIKEIWYQPVNLVYRDKILNYWYVLGRNYRRYTKYLYNRSSYDLFFRMNNVNYLRSRINYVTKGNNLIGYKMKLAGRFTRKQRAGHYWFSRGKTPLNTLSALVDYAIFYLPLKNSTISVRVWLYKSVDLEDTYYIKLY